MKRRSSSHVETSAIEPNAGSAVWSANIELSTALSVSKYFCLHDFVDMLQP